MKRIFFVLALTFLVFNVNGQKNDRLPNIIIIYIDDMGYGDVSPYNNEINYTPVFNGLLITA